MEDSAGRSRTTAIVRTVLGDVDPTELGHVQTHEHLLSDLSGVIRPWGLAPVAGGTETVTRAAGMLPNSEFPASVRARVAEPVRLENYDWIRRNVLNVDNLRLDSEEVAIDEARLFRAAGGGTLVDSTPTGLGRDPVGLARIARATGVHVVMGCGYYVRDYHPPHLDTAPTEAIRDQIVWDIEEGVGEARVRAGLIGEIGLSWPLHPVEEKVLRAAVQAQAATGAPLQVHPGRDSQAPRDAMRVVIDNGGAPDRTVISHIDRTLWDTDEMIGLARTGCYLAIDLFGQESSYYAFNPDARRPNDATRITWLINLIDAGFGDRLLISQDVCQKVYLRRYGGPGYAHILENVVPLMRRMGITREQVIELTVTNPARLLSLGTRATAG